MSFRSQVVLLSAVWIVGSSARPQAYEQFFSDGRRSFPAAHHAPFNRQIVQNQEYFDSEHPYATGFFSENQNFPLNHFKTPHSQGFISTTTPVPMMSLTHLTNQQLLAYIQHLRSLNSAKIKQNSPVIVTGSSNQPVNSQIRGGSQQVRQEQSTYTPVDPKKDNLHFPFSNSPQNMTNSNPNNIQPSTTTRTINRFNPTMSPNLHLKRNYTERRPPYSISIASQNKTIFIPTNRRSFSKPTSSTIKYLRTTMRPRKLQPIQTTSPRETISLHQNEQILSEKAPKLQLSSIATQKEKTGNVEVSTEKSFATIQRLDNNHPQFNITTVFPSKPNITVFTTQILPFSTTPSTITKLIPIFTTSRNKDSNQHTDSVPKPPASTTNNPLKENILEFNRNLNNYRHIKGFRSSHRRPHYIPSSLLFDKPDFKPRPTDEAMLIQYINNSNNTEEINKLMPILGLKGTIEYLRLKSSKSFPKKEVEIDKSRYSFIDKGSKLLEPKNKNIEINSIPHEQHFKIPEQLLPEQFKLLKQIKKSSNFENLRQGRSISARDYALNFIGNPKDISKLFLPINGKKTRRKEIHLGIKTTINDKDNSTQIDFEKIDVTNPVIRKELTKIAYQHNMSLMEFVQKFKSLDLEKRRKALIDVAATNPTAISKIQRQMYVSPADQNFSIGQLIAPSIKTAGLAIGDIKESIKENTYFIGKEAASLAQDTTGTVLKGVQNAGETLVNFGAESYYAGMATKTKLGDSFSDILKGFGEFLGTAVESTLERAVEAATLFGKFVNDIQDTAIDGALDKTEAAKKLVSKGMDSLGKMVDDTASFISDVTTGAIDAVTGYKETQDIPIIS